MSLRTCAFAFAPDDPHPADRQPRRDRLPHRRHGAPHGDRQRGGVLGRGCARRSCGRVRPGAAHRAGPGARQLSEHRADGGGGARLRRRCRASRLRLSRGKRLVRGGLRPGRVGVRGSAGRRHRGHGRQAAGQAADAAGGRAGDPRVRRRRRGRRGPKRRGHARARAAAGFPDHDQGGRRRRRARHPRGGARRSVRSGAGRVPAGSAGRVRRRARAAGALPGRPAPHRNAGVRRPPRRLPVAGRARLLGAAAPPEADRGVAGAGAVGSAAGAPGTGGGGGRARGRLCRCGNRGVPDDARRRILFHGDEHAPAGRASRHRDDHGPGSGGVAIAGRGRPGAALAAGPGAPARPRHRGAAVRRGPRARFPSRRRRRASPGAAAARGLCGTRPGAARGTRAAAHRHGGARGRHDISALRRADRKTDRLGTGPGAGAGPVAPGPAAHSAGRRTRQPGIPGGSDGHARLARGRRRHGLCGPGHGLPGRRRARRPAAGPARGGLCGGASAQRRSGRSRRGSVVKSAGLARERVRAAAPDAAGGHAAARRDGRVSSRGTATGAGAVAPRAAGRRARRQPAARAPGRAGVERRCGAGWADAARVLRRRPSPLALVRPDGGRRGRGARRPVAGADAGQDHRGSRGRGGCRGARPGAGGDGSDEDGARDRGAPRRRRATGRLPRRRSRPGRSGAGIAARAGARLTGAGAAVEQREKMMAQVAAGLPARVELVEVGPRDGLQNEPHPVPPQVKVELIDRLAAAGIRRIEAAAFVSPKWVPQMADGAEVLRRVRRHRGVAYSALVPNLKGFEAALAARVDEVVVFSAASETFCRRNINCSIDESIERFAPVCEAALRASVAVRGSISCALGCPYEGDVPPAAVARVARLMRQIGVQSIGVADTIGVGTPRATARAFEAVLGVYRLHEVSGHFHDTYGQALANIYACLQMGIARFDASVAGLGGCPFAAGATGNVATEDVLYLLHGLQIETGIDLAQVAQTGRWISGMLGRPSTSRAGNALLARRGT